MIYMNKIIYNNSKQDGNISIENLISSNGDWRVSYVYNNYGQNTLFLLPNYGVDDNEDIINNTVMDCQQDAFEIAYLVDQFINDHPSTPFIVRDSTVGLAIKLMDSRLGMYSSWEKFVDDAEEFNHWMQVVYIVSVPKSVKISRCGIYDSDDLMYMAYNKGWETVYDLIRLHEVQLPR